MQTKFLATILSLFYFLPTYTIRSESFGLEVVVTNERTTAIADCLSARWQDVQAGNLVRFTNRWQELNLTAAWDGIQFGSLPPAIILYIGCSFNLTLEQAFLAFGALKVITRRHPNLQFITMHKPKKNNIHGDWEKVFTILRALGLTIEESCLADMLILGNLQAIAEN